MKAHPSTTKILLVTLEPFWLRRSGAHQRIFTLHQRLHRRYQQVRVFYPLRMGWREKHTLRSMSWLHVHGRSWRNILLAGCWQVLRRLRLRPTWLRALTPEARRRHDLAALCGRLRPEVVIVEYLWAAYLVEGLREAAEAPRHLVLDTHDVMHLRSERFERQGIAGARGISRAQEAERLLQFDVLLAIQEEEARVLRNMMRGRQVLVVGHPQETVPPLSQVGTPVRLLFVGSAGPHNVAAIDEFLEHVWKPLHAEEGSIVNLHLVGPVCDALAGGPPPGVVLHGYVDDLSPIYAEAHVVINPAFAGSGLKIKNVEALCHGLPLMTTPIGEEGLPRAEAEAWVCCSSLEEMLPVLRRLIHHPEEREQLAGNAHAYALRHFSEAAALGALYAFLDHALDATADSP